MSDIIIEGKNLNDINQSNFQTVGVRSGFHFITDPNATLSDDESVFKYDVLKIHRTRLGDDYTNVLLPTELLEFVTIEPWQGRLHYDKDFSDITQVNLLNGFSWDDSWQPRNQDAIFKMRIPESIIYPSDNFISLYYPYFYTGNIYSTDDIINISSANDITKYKVNNSFGRYNNFLSKGFEQRTNDAFIVKDERFPLGTYTEEDKKHWEIQTSDLITRESQFSQTRMQTAQSSKIVESQLIKSEEEEFSVDALAFTEREGVITPLCFYYDKNLHPIEYNNASTGKINMKVELRESGRNGYNEIDLYQERKVVRPFLMGFEKDEQPNGGTNPLTDESLIGTGTVYGEGLYYAETRITLTSLPDANSYLLGIFDIPDNNLVSTTGNYTFMMPSQDIQYLTKFRPNPYIIMRQRFTDQFGNDTVGGPDSKGEIRLWESEVYLDDGPDESIYRMRPLNDDDAPAFKVDGARFFEDTFRPFDFDGNLITLEQREVTDNYKFKGFTYLSGSDDPQEVSFEILEDVENIDQNYYGPAGSDETNIRTIKLVQDFFYPAGRLNIYANYGLITFTIHNLNNTVDFENDFGGALRYGPFKFATVLGGQLGGAPNPENYRFDDFTSFPTFGLNEPTIRLLISGPEMGYANPGSTPLIEPIPEYPPEGWGPLDPMIGSLSPLEQWVWNGGPWVENPDYDPSNYLLFSDYLPSGEYGHLTPMEETGFEFGKFIWLRPGNPNFPDGEPIEIYKDISDDIPNTLQSAIDIAGEFPPTYTSNGFNDSVTGTQFSAGYEVGDTAGPNDLFIVTSVEEDQGGSDPYEGYYVWNVEWGPNFTSANTPDLGNLYDLSNNENDFQGINLRGDVGDDGLLVGNNFINQIISTETTSSIGYRPTYRGTYVKAIDDGIAVPTLIERSPNQTDEPIRPRSLSGVIDADMYEFGSEVIFNMTPSAESMPPEIAAYIGRDNGTKTLSTNINPNLTLEALGVEWNPDDWSPNGGGTFTYTVPDSRDAVTENTEARKWWKYIEFRIVVSETGESEEQSTEGDIQYHTNILYSAYFRNTDGALEQVSFNSPYSISSPPPETNFPPPDGIGNKDLYDTFDDVPNFSRRASAYVEGGSERVIEEWIIADRDFLDNFASQPGDPYYGIDIPASSINLAEGQIVGNPTQTTGVLEAAEAGVLNVVVIFTEGSGM